MKLLFLCQFSLLFLFHADGLGEYHYYLEENHILVSFEIDKRELQTYISSMDCGAIAMEDLCLANYINEYTELLVNNSKVTFEYSSSFVHNGHMIIKLKSKSAFVEVTDIKLTNNTFYKMNADFKNRVWIDIDSFDISYMLRKNRSELHLCL